MAIDSALPSPYRLPAVEEGAPIAYDPLINNGIVIDGTGAPRRQADAAVEDGARRKRRLCLN